MTSSVLRRRNLLAFATSLAQSDRNRLLAARHLATRAAALQLATLHLVHRALHLLRGTAAVFARRTTRGLLATALRAALRGSLLLRRCFAFCGHPREVTAVHVDDNETHVPATGSIKRSR